MKFENPFSKFSRIEGGTIHNYLEEREETYNYLTGHENSQYTESFNLTSYYMKYVWDNVQSFGGNRTFIEYMVAPVTKNNDYIFDKIEIDSRNYINLSYNGYVTFASRIFFGASWGRDARIFGIGGAGYNTLFYGADIFPTAAHIPIPWVMSYDLRPNETVKEKGRLLKKMYNEEWILFFEHDPKYQACTISLEGKHYCINKPVVISE